MKISNLFKTTLFILACLMLHVNTRAQMIYIHLKTQSEEISPDYSFNITGGVINSNFILNDKPDIISARDIASNGRAALFAAAGSTSGNNPVYRRNERSSSWTQISAIPAATKISAATNGNLIYTNDAGEIYHYVVATNTTSLIGTDVNVQDVAFTRVGVNLMYYCRSSGVTFVYDLSAPTPAWTQVPNVNANWISCAPNGDLIYYSYANNSMYRATPDGATITNLGLPGGPASSDVDIAASDDGTIVACNNGSAYRWVSGTTWVTEPSAVSISRVGGGVNSQIFGINMQSPAAFDIRTRMANGVWVDDERVQTVHAGNSIIYRVNPGTYTITQTAQPGWALHKVEITDPNSNSSSSVFTGISTINLEANEVIHVIYQNGIMQPVTLANTCDSTLFLEDFGSGSSFTPLTGQTSYHNLGNILQDGYYRLLHAIAHNTVPGVTMYDHTAGTAAGNARFMAINASHQQDEFYRRRFTNLSVGTEYRFSAWVMSWTNDVIKPNVRFEMFDPATGASLANVSSGDITTPAVWQKSTLSFIATQPDVDLVLSNNGPGGAGNDLGIDDITLTVSTDKGDAPASYGTLVANSGPCNFVSPMLRLGNLVDGESDGLPNANSNGDDNDGTDDEDGVALVSIIPTTNSNSQVIPTYSITTTYLNNTGSNATIAAWIDWNNNGTFEPSEGKTVTVPSSASMSSQTFTWNNVTLSGIGKAATYARIRISFGTGMTTADMNNAFGGGETEDYLVPFSTVLPVSIVSFTAQKQGHTANLRWETANMINVSHFEIERSANGVSFNKIGRAEVTAHNDYEFTDKAPAAGLNYYRLKIVDLDGSFGYSPVRSLWFDASTDITLAPNPAADKTVLSGISNGTRVLLTDMNGRMVKTYMANSSSLTIDLSSVAAGIYRVVVYPSADAASPVSVLKLIHQ